MQSERWVAVYEGTGAGRSVTAVRPLQPGSRVGVGREGQLLVGVRTPNQGISRRAVEVISTPAGWQVEIPNRNGAVVHPWAQPSQVAGRGDTIVINWPLVGVRLRHESETSQHWVLLSAGDLTVTPAGPGVPDPGTTQTDRAALPSQLPRSEREALQVVFADLLRWPPRYPAPPLLLKQAASRIGISVSGLQDRLKAVRARAAKLGLHTEGALTDPSDLYALVRAGYLALPPARPDDWPGGREVRR